jgi:outer membrane protein assembly factor BamB
MECWRKIGKPASCSRQSTLSSGSKSAVVANPSQQELLKMKSVVTRCSFIAILALLPAAAAQDFWPGWLGPARDGWVAGYETPSSWPENLTRSWSLEVGTGYGSPLVANGRVYQHARQGNDEVVWCVELSSGRVLWRAADPVPFKMGGGGEWHGKGPKSSPLLAGGRIFTMSIAGEVSAYDADSGRLLWRTNYSARFQPNHPYWGASTSPVVDGDRLFVHFGNDDKGVLAALDCATGEALWEQGSDGASYSSPVIADLCGVRQVVEWNHNVVAGIELQTGQRLWSYDFPHEATNQNMPTPAIYDGRILWEGRIEVSAACNRFCRMERGVSARTGISVMSHST